MIDARKIPRPTADEARKLVLEARRRAGGLAKLARIVGVSERSLKYLTTGVRNYPDGRQFPVIMSLQEQIVLEGFVRYGQHEVGGFQGQI